MKQSFRCSVCMGLAFVAGAVFGAMLMADMIWGLLVLGRGGVMP